MEDRKHCQLVGGPFDGDRGTYPLPLPEALWAYECPHPESCGIGGVHWTTDPEGIEGRGGERYVKDEERRLHEELGVIHVQLYVHDVVKLPRTPARARRVLPARPSIERPVHA